MIIPLPKFLIALIFVLCSIFSALGQEHLEMMDKFGHALPHLIRTSTEQINQPEFLLPNEVVLPNAYATQMGEAANGIPFGFLGRPQRYQQLFLGEEVGHGRALSSLCLRLNEAISINLTGGTIDVIIRIGESNKSLETMDLTYDNNFSSTPVTVYDGTITFPDYVAMSGNLSSFDVCVDFDQPFNFFNRPTNLLIEIIVPASLGFYLVDICTRCNTSRVGNFSDANADVADFLVANQGLVMKFGYEPIEIVPTLSQWGIIILGLTLFIFGLVAVRQRILLPYTRIS